MSGIATKNRPLSTYICGNPGSGKSSLMQRMVLRDIRTNQGVCVIDPGSDLLNTVIEYLPKSRKDDVIYFDTSMPVAIDFFSYHDPAERQMLSGYLVSLFHLENAPIAEPILKRVIGTLFDANDSDDLKKPENLKYRCTFLDIGHFCDSPSRKKEILGFCSQERREWWAEHPYTAKDLSPITGRMSSFLESPTLRTILGGKGSGMLNIWDVMQKNKVLLVNLDDTSADDLFVGSLIISKFQQAAFRRRLIAGESKRIPYYLYIDECDSVLKFAVNDFANILKRSRKFKLCLTLANPVPSDLPLEIQNKLGTIGNLVLFNLDHKDANVFKHRVSPYTPEQLTNLPKFTALFRTNNQVVPLKTPSFLPRTDNDHARYIRMRTLKLYSCKADLRPDNPGNGKPEPQGTVLPNEAQEAGSRSARSVFRPAEQRPRTPSPKPRPDSNRRPNDKPDP